MNEKVHHIHWNILRVVDEYSIVGLLRNPSLVIPHDDVDAMALIDQQFADVVQYNSREGVQPLGIDC